jgi:hypothetical protein
VTNSFQDWDRTEAAMFEMETLMVVKQGIVLEPELTPDVYVWLIWANRTGSVYVVGNCQLPTHVLR